MLCAIYPTMDLQIRQVLIPRQRLKPWIVLASTNPKRYFSFSKGWIEENICISAWHVSGSIGLIEADRGVRVAWAHFSGSCGGKPKFLWVPAPEGGSHCNPNFTNIEKVEQTWIWFSNPTWCFFCNPNFIFRHARVSSTYPCQSVGHTFGFPASLVALREKLKRENPNYFCVFSESAFSESVFSKGIFSKSVFSKSVFF